MSDGKKQEQVLFDYLRISRHCTRVIESERRVRQFIEMNGEFKCADALGLHQVIGAPGPRRFTIGESKGTDMDSALAQLGNAAAGIFQMFGRETIIDLLVMIPNLVKLPIGITSPGNGFQATPLITGRRKFILQESKGTVLQASPKVSYPDWMKWATEVARLRIVLVVLQDQAV